MLKILELFGGIGACTQALKRLGIDFEIVDYVEIDKYAVKSYNAINDTNFYPQDITDWDKDIKVDLIMHGSPCQDFSIAGKQAGGDENSGTRSSLMYETIRIVESLNPKYVVWENVKNLLSKKHKHNFDEYLEKLNQLGYNNYYQVLNAKDYGIPQNRVRVYTISIRKDIDKGNFEFPEKEELKLRLKDMLEEQVDEKYYLSDKQVNRIKTTTYNVGKTRIQEKEYCDTLCARDWKDPKCVRIEPQLTNNDKRLQPLVDKTEFEEGKVLNLDTYNQTTNENISQTLTEPNHNTQRLFDGLRIRKLTPKECWRLMGFDDSDIDKCIEIGISNTQLYKQAGNSIVVNVLYKIFKNLLKE